MKNFAIVAGVCIAAYIFYSFQDVKLAINESLNHGTLKGVENCVAYSQSELVSEETTKNTCISRLHKTVYDGVLASGLARTRERSDKVYLEVTLNNETSDFITTWFKLRLFIFDAQGSEKTFDAETFLWIEPQSPSDFSVVLKGLTAKDLVGLTHCENFEWEAGGISCFVWGSHEIKGIKI